MIKKSIKIEVGAFREILKKSLNEALSSFNKQYELADFCADKVKEMINNGETEGIFEYNSDDIKKVKLTLSNINIVGQLCGINPEEKTAIITLGKQCQNKSKNEISNIIAHEIMHGNVLIKRHSHNIDTYDEMPFYYENLFEVFEKYYGTIAYYFAHALYASYFNETNALVSQIYSDVKMRLLNLNIKTVSRDKIYRLFKNTNSFKEFYTCIYETVPYIINMSDKEIEKEIIQPFKECGIDFNIKFVRYKNKLNYGICVKALHHCQRNLWLLCCDIKNGKIEGIVWK